MREMERGWRRGKGERFRTYKANIKGVVVRGRKGEREREKKGYLTRTK